MKKAELRKMIRELAKEIWEKNPEKVREIHSHKFIHLGFWDGYLQTLIESEGGIDYKPYWSEGWRYSPKRLLIKVYEMLLKISKDGCEEKWKEHLKWGCTGCEGK